MSKTRDKDRYIRCFKDDAVMMPVKGHPDWIRCTLCGFATKMIGYNSASVRRDFDDTHPELYESEKNDGALYPNGHLAPQVRQDKQGGGSKSGRSRKDKMQKKAVQKWTLA